MNVTAVTEMLQFIIQEDEDYLELGLLILSQSTWIRGPIKSYKCPVQQH